MLVQSDDTETTPFSEDTASFSLRLERKVFDLLFNAVPRSGMQQTRTTDNCTHYRRNWLGDVSERSSNETGEYRLMLYALLRREKVISFDDHTAIRSFQSHPGLGARGILTRIENGIAI